MLVHLQPAGLTARRGGRRVPEMGPAGQYAPPEQQRPMRVKQALHGQSRQGWHHFGRAHHLLQETMLAPWGQQVGVYSAEK